MARPNDKLKQTIAEDRKHLLLRMRRWPFALWMTVALPIAGAAAGYWYSQDFLPLVSGAVAGLVLAALFQKAFANLENLLSAKLYEWASRIEVVEQADPKDRSSTPNALLDDFGLSYCGGHPTWKADQMDYGRLEVFERAVVFKNLRNRFRMPMARCNRITLESPLQVRVRRIPDVILPQFSAKRNKVTSKVQELLRKKQRYVVLDYTDDTGCQRLIVFYPPWGNPRAAKQVKEVFDSALRKNLKDRATRTATEQITTPSSAAKSAGGSQPATARSLPQALPTSTLSGRSALKAVPQEVIEAAKRASKTSSAAPTLQLQAGGPAAALTAKQCPYCKFSLKAPTVVCSVCGAEHHAGCWKANFSCTTEGCRGKPVEVADNQAVEASQAVEAGSHPLAAETRPGVGESATSAAAEVRYQVVLYGTGNTDDEREAVAVQLSSSFGIPIDKCRIALAKVPAVAKRNLPLAEAKALATRFAAMGADARVEAVH